MLYSNLPFPISSSPIARDKNCNFFLNNEIVLGEKIGLHILCPKITVVSGMNEDLSIRFTRKGELCIEKHVPDWRDADPKWNWPDQLFLLLFGEKIEVRAQDVMNFKKHAHISEENEQYEVLEINDNSKISIVKMLYFHPKEIQYLIIYNKTVGKFWARTHELLEMNAKAFKISLKEFNCEWKEI